MGATSFLEMPSAPLRHYLIRLRINKLIWRSLSNNKLLQLLKLTRKKDLLPQWLLNLMETCHPNKLKLTTSICLLTNYSHQLLTLLKINLSPKTMATMKKLKKIKAQAFKQEPKCLIRLGHLSNSTPSLSSIVPPWVTKRKTLVLPLCTSVKSWDN